MSARVDRAGAPNLLARLCDEIPHILSFLDDGDVQCAAAACKALNCAARRAHASARNVSKVSDHLCSVPRLEWALGFGAPRPSTHDCCIAAGSKPLAVLQHMHVRLGCELDARVSAAAAHAGRVDALEWLASAGVDADEESCGAAAFSGHLATCKWLLERGVPADAWTCSCAAWGGHTDIVALARAHDVPWDEQTAINAAFGGHVHTFAYAHAHGAPIRSWLMCALAARAGQQEAAAADQCLGARPLERSLQHGGTVEHAQVLAYILSQTPRDTHDLLVHFPITFSGGADDLARARQQRVSWHL